MKRTSRIAMAFCAGLIVAAVPAGAADFPARDPNRTVLGKNSLVATDVDKTAAYYKLLGMQEIYRYKNEKAEAANDRHSHVVALNYNARQGNYHEGLSIQQARGPFVLGNNLALISLVVKDIKAVCQRLAAAKTPCTNGPELAPSHGGALSAMSKDPDGREVQLIQDP